MKKASILHVLLSARAEGTPRLVLDWLKVPGYEQHVLFLTSEHAELEKDFATHANVEFNANFKPSVKNVMKIAGLVKRKSLELSPDLVISWPMGFSQYIHIGAFLGGAKSYLVYGGNPPGNDFLGKYLYSYFSFWTGYILGSKTLCCSNYIRDAFRSIPFLSKNQFQTVYNCLDIKRFKFSDPRLKRSKENRIVMVATLERHKDHKALLKAWKIVENRGHDFTLDIVGDGQLSDSLLQLKKELALKKVNFLGSRNDIPRLLWRSKVFVFSTTRQEGFGTVLIEALAAGLKIVASDVPACREVLCNGRYGQLVTPGNPELLAQAIIEAIKSPIEEEELSNQLEYVKRFTAESMISQYLSHANLP